MNRVEVLAGPERHRRWSEAQKRSIVAEAFAPGASVGEVARRRDVRPGQIYRWRRDLRGVDLRGVDPGDVATSFAEVVVAPEPGMRAPAGVAAVEIEFGGDVRVRIGADVPAELARAIVKTLVAR